MYGRMIHGQDSKGDLTEESQLTTYMDATNVLWTELSSVKCSSTS